MPHLPIDLKKNEGPSCEGDFVMDCASRSQLRGTDDPPGSNETIMVEAYVVMRRTLAYALFVVGAGCGKTLDLGGIPLDGLRGDGFDPGQLARNGSAQSALTSKRRCEPLLDR